MAVETTFNVVPGRRQGDTRVAFTEYERLIGVRATTSWMVCPWAVDVEENGIVNSLKANGVAAKYAADISSGVFPVRKYTNGPNNQRYFEALSADPVGALRTEASIVQTTTAFTFDFVGKAGTTLTGAQMAVEGSSGGAVGIALRSDSRIVVSRYDAAGTGTALYTSGTSITAADWHHVTFSYDHSGSGEFKLWVDGTLLTTVAGQISFGTSRLNLFMAYDTGVVLNTQADESKIASAFVINEYAGGADTSLLDLLDAAANERFAL